MKPYPATLTEDAESYRAGYILRYRFMHSPGLRLAVWQPRELCPPEAWLRAGQPVVVYYHDGPRGAGPLISGVGRVALTQHPRTVCYYCLGYLNGDGFRLVNQGELQLLPADSRCDYCDRREQGKLYAPRGPRG